MDYQTAHEFVRAIADLAELQARLVCIDADIGTSEDVCRNRVEIVASIQKKKKILKNILVN